MKISEYLRVEIPLCPVSICFEMDSDVAGLSIVRSRFLDKVYDLR